MSGRGYVNTAIKASKKNKIWSLIFTFILVKNHINVTNVTMLVIHLQILPSTRKINTNKFTEKTDFPIFNCQFFVIKARFFINNSVYSYPRYAG